VRISASLALGLIIMPGGLPADDTPAKPAKTSSREVTSKPATKPSKTKRARVPENRFTIRKRIDNMKPSDWLQKFGVVEVQPRSEPEAVPAAPAKAAP
jgi:hypothetical protein